MINSIIDSFQVDNVNGQGLRNSGESLKHQIYMGPELRS